MYCALDLNATVAGYFRACGAEFIGKKNLHIHKQSLFTARDAMRKRGLCCRPVSVRRVRPSVTLVYCIHKAEDIFKLLSRSDSLVILVFLTPMWLPNTQGNPFSGGAKYTEAGKIAIFD